MEECLANARDVIAAFVELMTERGEPLPPSDIATSIAITLPAPAG